MINPPLPLPTHNPGAITLYGAPLVVQAGNNYNIAVNLEPVVGLLLEVRTMNWGWTLALIYGYSFEGQCYQLERPKIMLVPDNGTLAIGCGYHDFPQNAPRAQTYQMWYVEKFAPTVEVDVNVGRFEQLVLEANLPGRRNPNTYSSNMMLSHRSGRFSE